MPNLIIQWFTPPVFEGDEEKTYQARLLNASTFVLIVFPALVIIGNLLGRSTPISTTVIDIFAVASGLLLRGLLQRGKTKIVGIALLSLGIVLTTGAITSLGTIRTPTTSVYLLLVITAGVLFDLRGIQLTTLASSLAVLGLVLAENAGILPAPDYRVTITQWLTFSVLFAVTGGLMFFGIRTTKKALTRAELEITERESVELKLRKLSLAVEQSPASIVITDLAGNIEYANTRFTQVTGYVLGEALGKNPRILKTDLTPPGTHQKLWETITAGKEWRGEFVNRKKDGSLYYESATISPITDSNGAISHYLAVKEDISERKRFEQSLSEIHSRLHLLGENLEDAALYVYSHDLAGKPHFEYLSAGMEKLTGLKTEDILRDAGCLHNLILPEYLPRLAEMEQKSKLDLRGFEMEVRERHALSNQINWALLRSTPRRRADGSTVWYGVQIDITERKRNEKLIEQANEQLRIRMQEIELLQDELREQAIRDPLTGLYNRRYLGDTLAREILRAERENIPLSIVIMDADHFKMINDTHGHQAGDKFLVEIAGLLRKYSRGSDVVCRLGGEEFLLVLPGTSTQSAYTRAEEIRQKCAQLSIQLEHQELRVTLSFGVATFPDHGKGMDEIISKADSAMYLSKSCGRNRVTVWSQDQSSA